MDDSGVGDALRRLAAEAPSDEGLLGAVHAASSRAAVRRRVLAASLVVLAVLGVAGVVSATGSDAPAGRELVLGAPDETTDPELTPLSPSASAAGDGTPSSQVTATYRGRALSPDGAPVAGLYVYVIPGMKSYWFRTEPVTRTAADGTFELPCPKGVVLLNAFELSTAQDGDTRNWRTTYVGGGTLLGDAQRPRCSQDRETTVVPPGSVIEGTVAVPPGCSAAGWNVRVESEPAGHIAYDQGWLQTPIRQDGTYRLAGLPSGQYQVYAQREYGQGAGQDAYGQVTVTSPATHQLDLGLDDTACAPPTPGPTQTGPPDDPEASPSPEPAPTPTPEPEAS